MLRLDEVTTARAAHGARPDSRCPGHEERLPGPHRAEDFGSFLVVLLSLGILCKRNTNLFPGSLPIILDSRINPRTKNLDFRWFDSDSRKLSMLKSGTPGSIRKFRDTEIQRLLVCGLTEELVLFQSVWQNGPRPWAR